MMAGCGGMSDMDERREFSDLCLVMDEEVARRLEERAIRPENVREVIAHAERTNSKLVNEGTGRFLAHHRPGAATYWVEYSPARDGFRVHNAYSHMMQIVGEEDRP